MTRPKPQTPYQRLIRAVRKYVSETKNPKQIPMWKYSRKNLRDLWKLDALYERTYAAQQLGYDVILKTDEEWFYVYYQKRPSKIDYCI